MNLLDTAPNVAPPARVPEPARTVHCNVHQVAAAIKTDGLAPHVLFLIRLMALDLAIQAHPPGADSGKVLEATRAYERYLTNQS